jgi:hypothetical protein
MTALPAANNSDIEVQRDSPDRLYPERDGPMIREEVQGPFDAFGAVTINVRSSPLGHHEHGRCPNCGYVVESAIPAEPR